MINFLIGKQRKFQSTRPRGARPRADPVVLVGRVSIHAPTWSATPRASAPTQRPSFNPRAHVERDERLTHSTNVEKGFQSTRPRGARRSGKLLDKILNVSIHAPTWSATQLSCFCTTESERFQSTRPRGARRRRPPRMISYPCFNPRAHVERDRAAANRLPLRLVSIHAPTWSATIGAPLCLILLRFQSTRPRGARRQKAEKELPMLLFQSTRPRGARLQRSINNRGEVGFNPRAHVERDMLR